MSIKDIPFPFKPDSEEDVKLSLVLLFKSLGFTQEEMSFEDSFQIQLGHTAIIVEKAKDPKIIRGRSDILVTYQGEPLAIIETKAPDVVLTDDDRDQGLSYARLIRQMPVECNYSIQTNYIENYRANPKVLPKMNHG